VESQEEVEEVEEVEELEAVLIRWLSVAARRESERPPSSSSSGSSPPGRWRREAGPKTVLILCRRARVWSYG
jgi:hypothetical protein